MTYSGCYAIELNKTKSSVVSYLGLSLEWTYPSTEIQMPYSEARPDWTNIYMVLSIPI